jgi:signal recognition particle subunit SRP54
LRGKGRLTEDAIRETLREVRIALLEADVALPVVQQFVAEVARQASGQQVLQSLTPGQAMVKLVHDELVRTMGDANEALDLRAQPPVVILMAGLQGSGKTTTTAKLARHLMTVEKKRVMVVSCDVYRPAAIDQLQTLAEQTGALFHPSRVDQRPAAIARQAVESARQKMCDVLLVDTAGRLHVDDEMMSKSGTSMRVSHGKPPFAAL